MTASRTSRSETLIAADPRAPDLPQGECILTRLDDGRVRIEHADPKVMVSVELINQINYGYITMPRGVTLDRSACTKPYDHEGAVLRIEGVNQTVIYRLTEHVFWYCGYIAEWPD